MDPQCEAQSVSSRPVVGEDDAFLRLVFASTREVEGQYARWDVGEWDAFIHLQEKAQRVHYDAHFPAAQHDIILRGKQPVGRIWVHRASNEIRLLDIAILPEWRCQGIGTTLIRRLQLEARRACVPLRHSVEAENPRARQLYERLGFVSVETRGLHTLMEWAPSESTCAKK